MTEGKPYSGLVTFPGLLRPSFSWLLVTPSFYPLATAFYPDDVRGNMDRFSWQRLSFSDQYENGNDQIYLLTCLGCKMATATIYPVNVFRNNSPTESLRLGCMPRSQAPQRNTYPLQGSLEFRVWVSSGSKRLGVIWAGVWQ